MKIHRFIGDFDLSGKKIAVTDRELFNQIKNVLKLKVGEPIMLGNGAMDEAQGRIAAIGPKGVEVEIIKRGKNANETGVHAVLYCAVLKKENFELVVQKATEVGVKEIVPVISRRTIKLNLNIGRLEKIAKEAAEQSGRGIVPPVHEPVAFKEALKHAAPNDANYFFEMDAPLFDRGVLRMKGMNRIGIFIGTEGGWDEEELELAKKNYFHVASLGPLTFRAETAAVIGSYLVTTSLL